LRRRRFGIELDHHRRFVDDSGIVPWLHDDHGRRDEIARAAAPCTCPVPRSQLRRPAEFHADEWFEVRRPAEAWRRNQPFAVAIRGPDAIDDTATHLLMGGAFARGKQVPIASPTSFSQPPEWRAAESRIAAWK
jgi:hypothetical protein